MNAENIDALPRPVKVKSLPNKGLITNHSQLAEAVHLLIPDLNEHEGERIDHHLTELLNSLARGRGRLPRDVVSTPEKGEMTHILNGRLMRRNGIWIALHFGTERDDQPLEILSITRGYESHLSSILGGTRVKMLVNRVHHPKRSGSHR